MSKDIYILGIAGGSGSGKTTFARALMQKLQTDECAVISQDSYYIDQSQKFDGDGGSVNFDHPDAIEFSLLAKHLGELKKGHSVQIPIYDFATHTRQKETIPFHPKKIIIVDGILILSQPEVFQHFDESLFLEVDEELRFRRRLKRDTTERGRTEEGVRAQFYKQVKPMHDLFVGPSIRNATKVIQVSEFDKMVEFYAEKLSKLLK